jgi:hydrogenase maturation protease
MKPIAIIGVGNYLMSDEGVGIHATKKLRQEMTRDDCDIIDAGVPSLALVHMLQNRKLTIIIDCADFGGRPGEMKAFKPEDVHYEHQSELSLHAGDLLTTLEMSKTLGLSLPNIVIIGIQPDNVEKGMQLSNKVQKALAKLPDLVADIVKQYNVTTYYC